MLHFDIGAEAIGGWLGRLDSIDVLFGFLRVDTVVFGKDEELVVLSFLLRELLLVVCRLGSGTLQSLPQIEDLLVGRVQVSHHTTHVFSVSVLA